MTPAYISLGSNLGDSLSHLRSAVQAIRALPKSRLGALSSLWRSAAIGPGEQPDYLNAVLLLETDLSAHDLLDTLQHIEIEQGRVRHVRWGPRTLDLDILLYGCREIADERLQVPHPRMAERNFVLYPLLEVAPANLMLPGGAELGTLVSACPGGDLTRTALTLEP